jgi:hypothetical protein
MESVPNLNLYPLCAYHDTMVERGSSGGEEGFTGRVTSGYGCDGEIFDLGLAHDEWFVEGWVEGCLERSAEDDLERGKS